MCFVSMKCKLRFGPQKAWGVSALLMLMSARFEFDLFVNGDLW